MTKFVIVVMTTAQLKDITGKLFDAGHFNMTTNGNNIGGAIHITFDIETYEESLAIKEIVTENNLESFKY